MINLMEIIAKRIKIISSNFSFGIFGVILWPILVTIKSTPKPIINVIRSSIGNKLFATYMNNLKELIVTLIIAKFPIKLSRTYPVLSNSTTLIGPDAPIRAAKKLYENAPE